MIRKKIQSLSNNIEILLKTDEALKLFTRILRDQLEKQIFYTELQFYSPFGCILDFPSFHSWVGTMQLPVSAPIDKLLKEIKTRASSNITMFQKLVDNKKVEQIIKRTLKWELNEHWYSDPVKSKKTQRNPLKLENQDFLQFCFKVLDLLQVTFQDKAYGPPEDRYVATNILDCQKRNINSEV
jgi:hypothetical protein